MYTRHRFSKYSLNIVVAIISNCSGNFCLAQAQGENSGAATSEGSSAVLSEKPPYSSTTERDALLALAKPDEIQWLETPSGKVLSLFKAGELRKTKGTLLILHAPELSQRWPAALDNLRRNLPLYGWATMAVSLPPNESQQLSVKTELKSEAPEAASSAAESPATTANDNESKPSIPRSQIIGERVKAALAQIAKNEPTSTVILVDNSGAPDSLAVAYKNISQGSSGVKNGPLKALVLVNLQDQEALSRDQLKAIFSVSDLPIIDVFFKADDAFQLEMRRVHRAEAMRQNVKDYQQLVLPPEHLATVNDKRGFWLEKIRGFMEKTRETAKSGNVPTQM